MVQLLLLTCRPIVLLMCCAVLCCTVLCCAVLCCVVLCCVVLCCAVWRLQTGSTPGWLREAAASLLTSTVTRSGGVMALASVMVRSSQAQKDMSTAAQMVADVVVAPPASELIEPAQYVRMESTGVVALAVAYALRAWVCSSTKRWRLRCDNC